MIWTDQRFTMYDTLHTVRMRSIQQLDYAERWLRDGLQESGHAGAFEAIEVDVSEASRALAELKGRFRSVTWLHVFVWAVARTLAQNPELHRLVAGTKQIYPESVDICVSVAGDASVTPVLIIENAATKDVLAVAAEVKARSPEAVRDSERMIVTLRRWGWIMPFSIIRRALMRFLLRRIWYRRKVSGTFQVSCLPQVDVFAPLLFNTAAALGIGRVRDKVTVVNGVAVVRPMVTLTCCLDHSVWNGMAAAHFLADLREILESAEFIPELKPVQPLSETPATFFAHEQQPGMSHAV